MGRPIDPLMNNAPQPPPQTSVPSFRTLDRNSNSTSSLPRLPPFAASRFQPQRSRVLRRAARRRRHLNSLLQPTPPSVSVPPIPSTPAPTPPPPPSTPPPLNSPPRPLPASSPQHTSALLPSSSHLPPLNRTASPSPSRHHIHPHHHPYSADRHARARHALRAEAIAASSAAERVRPVPYFVRHHYASRAARVLETSDESSDPDYSPPAQPLEQPDVRQHGGSQAPTPFPPNQRINVDLLRHPEADLPPTRARSARFLPPWNRYSTPLSMLNSIAEGGPSHSPGPRSSSRLPSPARMPGSNRDALPPRDASLAGAPALPSNPESWSARLFQNGASVDHNNTNGDREQDSPAAHPGAENSNPLPDVHVNDNRNGDTDGYVNGNSNVDDNGAPSISQSPGPNTTEPRQIENGMAGRPRRHSTPSVLTSDGRPGPSSSVPSIGGELPVYMRNRSTSLQDMCFTFLIAENRRYRDWLRRERILAHSVARRAVDLERGLGNSGVRRAMLYTSLCSHFFDTLLSDSDELHERLMCRSVELREQAEQGAPSAGGRRSTAPRGHRRNRENGDEVNGEGVGRERRERDMMELLRMITPQREEDGEAGLLSNDLDTHAPRQRQPPAFVSAVHNAEEQCDEVEGGEGSAGHVQGENDVQPLVEAEGMARLQAHVIRSATQSMAESLEREDWQARALFEMQLAPLDVDPRPLGVGSAARTNANADAATHHPIAVGRLAAQGRAAQGRRTAQARNVEWSARSAERSARSVGRYGVRARSSEGRG